MTATELKREYYKQYREKNKEQIKKKYKEWRDNNKEKDILCLHRKGKNKYTGKDRRREMYYSAFKRSW